MLLVVAADNDITNDKCSQCYCVKTKSFSSVIFWQQNVSYDYFHNFSDVLSVIDSFYP